METHTKPENASGTRDADAERAIFWVYPEERLHFLRRGTTLIGRSPDAGIQLSGDQVSRRHATLTVTDTEIVLRDEGSLNKPRCNLLQLPELRLSNNDVVRIGGWVGVVLEGVTAVGIGSSPFEQIDANVLVGPRSRANWLTLKQVAVGNLAVVIEGESGTGKEIVARALHRESRRSGRFVAVNCAAQPAGLFESHFFGHTKGAFTGAINASEGFVAAADGGTLFLDELLDLDLAQQAKVLRVVEESRVVPVGSTRPVDVDLRIVCAVQRSLARAADEGKFRSDLYARLNGVTLRLLPLRERREEILRLFRLALDAGAEPTHQLSPGFVERLCLQPWRLNVRELIATARRARALFSNLSLLSSRELSLLMERGPEPSLSSDPGNTPVQERGESAVAGGTLRPPSGDDATEVGARTRAWFARHRGVWLELQRVLPECKGNVSQAARKLGISRQHAQRLIQAAIDLGLSA